MGTMRNTVVLMLCFIELSLRKSGFRGENGLRGLVASGKPFVSIELMAQGAYGRTLNVSLNNDRALWIRQ